MKIFAIRDETDNSKKDLGYLFYFEAEHCFYIELPGDAEYWETPLLLSSFLERGEYTIDSHWSGLWVRQRIVPPERQNIGQILKENGLTGYDEYEILKLSCGRCAQDDYYLVPIRQTQLPEAIQHRRGRRILDILPLQNRCMLVIFQDSTVKKCNLDEYMKEESRFSILTRRADYYSRAGIQPGGYGIEWDENLTLSASYLYETGETLPLTADDFRAFASERIVDTAAAAELLGCSRQYINELVRKGKLQPVRISGKNTSFMKSDILQLKWR